MQVPFYLRCTTVYRCRYLYLIGIHDVSRAGTQCKVIHNVFQMQGITISGAMNETFCKINQISQLDVFQLCFTGFGVISNFSSIKN